jgi:uncharacterized protein
MRTKMVLFFVLLFLMIISSRAQETEIPSILITTSSVTQIPAYAIYFGINLNVQNEEPMKAYEEHRILEKKLLEILSDLEIPDTNVGYSLLHMNISSPFSKEKQIYQTRQTISVKVIDFSKYESLQLTLLSNGIYNYNAKFTSSGEEKWVEKGIAEALIKNKNEAVMTVENLNKALGEIIRIESSHYYPSTSDGISAVTMQAPGETLIDLPHFVPMRVTLRVWYELLDK